MVETMYAKNTGEGLNPDERIKEEDDIALIESSRDTLESDAFGQENIREFIAASERLGLMEETDPANISNLDERVHFQIEGKQYAYDQETYSAGMSTEEAKSLIKLEEKFHTLEIKDRKLKGIDSNVDMIDIEKEHLEEIRREIIQITKHEEREERYKAQGKEYDDFGVLVNELKEASKEHEGYKGKSLEEKIATINKAEGNQEVFRFVSAVADVEDASQAKFDEIKKSRADIQVDVPEFELGEIKAKAIELIIQKEVANRMPEVPMTFGSAGDLLKSELSEENLKQNLSDVDLKAYYTDRFITHKELFDGQETDENRVQREEILDYYTKQARTRVVERLNEIPDEEWLTEIPYEKIRPFLLKGENVSISEIASFLDKGQFISLYERVYLYDRDNLNHFDIEGRPIDNDGKEIIRRFRETAAKTVESSEYLGTFVENEFDGNPVGKAVNKAWDKCQEIMSDSDAPHNRMERILLKYFSGAEGKRKLETIDQAKKESEVLESFKKRYQNKRGAYIAKVWDFERTVREEVGENILDENLSQRDRKRIKKVALRLNQRRLMLNRKLEKEMESLAGLEYLQDYYKENSFESLKDLTSKGMVGDKSWSPSKEIGSTQDNEKYGTTLTAEAKEFAESMDYGLLKDNVDGYIRNEVADTIKSRIAKTLDRERAEKSSKYDRAMLRINKRFDIDIRYEDYLEANPGIFEKMVNDRSSEYFLKLKNQFKNENKDGLMRFAAQTGYRGKIIRKELHEEIFGDKETGLMSVNKIINLLDGQRISELMDIEKERQFKKQIKLFCGVEGIRQRKEKLTRKISGNPLFRKTEYTNLRSALEDTRSKSVVARNFKTSIETKDFFLDLFGGYSIGWNKAKRGTYKVINFFAPLSVGLEKKIEETHANEIRRKRNADFRDKRRVWQTV